MTENDLHNSLIISNDINPLDNAAQKSLENSSNFLSLGNTALEKEIITPYTPITNNHFELPECLKNLSLQEIFEKGMLSDEGLEALKVSHANDNLPLLPTDPNQMDEFITRIKKNVSAELAILKSTPLPETEYLIRFQKLQIQASYQLLAECMIGEELRQIKCCKGLKSKGKKEGKRSKRDVITAKYPLLGARRCRDFQKLFFENVWEAIKTAFEQGVLPTRALALSYGINKKARTGSNKTPSDFKKWRGRNDDFETAIKLLELSEELKACSLFCNIGIGTSLLEKLTNIRIVVANEKDKRRGRAHRRLYPNCDTIIGEIDNPEIFEQIVAANKKYGAKLLLASPPCQEASLLNTSKNKGTSHRAALFEDMLNVIRAVGYDYIFIENVPQWLNSRPAAALSILGNKTIGEYVVEELEKLGYNVTVGILSAADYETAENRERAIILACKKDLGVWKFPMKHKFRPTVFETIGSMQSLEAGEVDPNNKWHYGVALEEHEIEFLQHTPTGCSAWDNLVKFQPKNKDASYANGQFKKGYTRINPAAPSPTITSDSGQIGGLSTIHYGRPLSDGTFSDSRVLSIAELLKIIGTDDDFLEPLNAPKTSEDDFDSLTWENAMLTKPDEHFIREVLGEHVCPKFMLNLMSTLPIPSNDNKSEDSNNGEE